MRRLIIILFSFVLTGIYAAPKSNLWEFWDISNENNKTTIEYSFYDDFLKKYIEEDGENTLVNYSGVTKKDHQSLIKLIDELSKIEIRDYNRREQKVYWINLYNILTISKILEYYPVKSILNIRTSGLFKSGPWDEKVIVIEGEGITLNDIEHRILRPIWKDHRVHYLLNCASIGCPNIGSYAYTYENIESSLNEAEINFLNSGKGLTKDGKSVVLSSIFKWYREDFGKNEKELLYYIGSVTGYDPTGYKIKYDYNWDLNEVK